VQRVLHAGGAGAEAALARVMAQPRQGPQAVAQRLRVERLQGRRQPASLCLLLAAVLFYTVRQQQADTWMSMGSRQEVYIQPQWDTVRWPCGAGSMRLSRNLLRSWRPLAPKIVRQHALQNSRQLCVVPKVDQVSRTSGDASITATAPSNSCPGGCARNVTYGSSQLTTFWGVAPGSSAVSRGAAAASSPPPGL